MTPDHMDDGLTRAWALYWAAVQEGSLGNDIYTQTSATPRIVASSLTATTTTPGTAASSVTTTLSTPETIIAHASCSSPKHPACKNLAAGYCCPALEGIMLSCCTNLPTSTMTSLKTDVSSHVSTMSKMTNVTTASIEKESESTSAVATNDCLSPSHSACNHLRGNCCPMDDGIMLSCCGATTSQSADTDQLSTTISHCRYSTVAVMFLLVTAMFCLYT